MRIIIPQITKPIEYSVEAAKHPRKSAKHSIIIAPSLAPIPPHVRTSLSQGSDPFLFPFLAPSDVAHWFMTFDSTED